MGEGTTRKGEGRGLRKGGRREEGGRRGEGGGKVEKNEYA